MKIPARIVRIDRTPVVAGDDALSQLGKLCRSLRLDPGKAVILCDTNTFRNCYPVFSRQVREFRNARVLTVPAGEASKTLETAAVLWKELMDAGAGRDTLLVNLGGGMITDLGGFVAAAYKRGIPCIHIPTTLLGQVDAAIGGKTGVNFGLAKNQMGFFYPPAAVCISGIFLDTLSADHFRSGSAEIIKSVLISDPVSWRKMKRRPIRDLAATKAVDPFWQEMIFKAVRFKLKITSRDFREKKLRKVLNFGHTIGHAIEAASLTPDQLPLLHGDAVAIGIFCAAYLSEQKTGLSENETSEIMDYIRDGFGRYQGYRAIVEKIPGFLVHDKKNREGKTNFTLLAAIGSPKLNVRCTEKEVADALESYGK